MNGFRLSPKARADLKKIKVWSIPRWGEERCARYLRELRESFRRLGEYPMLGAACDDVRPGYRRLEVGEHHIYYRVEPGSVAIVRVFPQVMHATKNILDEAEARP